MKNQSQAFVFIFITLLIDVMGIALIIPVLPDLLASLTHTNNSQASEYSGWLNVTYALMQFAFSPLLGALSDRFGRKPVLLLSLGGLGLDYLFMAFAPTLPWLFVGRIISGIMGASFTTATAYIADISSPEDRAKNFGMIGAAFGLGFILGPVLGGLLGELNPKAPFMAAAILSGLNFIYGIFVLPESLAPEHRRKPNWKLANPLSAIINLNKYGNILWLLACMFLIYLAGHAAQSTWAFINIEKFNWSKSMIGISLGVVGIMVALVQVVMIKFFIQKFGDRNTVLMGLAFSGMGALLFTFANASWMMFAFSLPYVLGGIASPTMQGIISNKVPANQQGELQGTITSVISITNILGPLIMNNLFSVFTSPGNIYFPGAPFAAGFLLALVSIGMAWIFFRNNFSKK